MVSSGLAGTLTKVSQYRLAFHLTFACAIYAAVLWTAQQIAPQTPSDAPKRLRFGALAIAALLLVQIYLGALVAGLDAGLKYNTWPLIDGAFMPSLDRLLFISPLWRNLFENDSDRSVQPSHAGRCDLAAGRCLHACRRLARAARGARRHHSGGRGDAAGRARHRHAALSGAACARARAPGAGDRGVHDRGRACRAAVASRDRSVSPRAAGQGA